MGNTNKSERNINLSIYGKDRKKIIGFNKYNTQFILNNINPKNEFNDWIEIVPEVTNTRTSNLNIKSDFILTPSDISYYNETDYKELIRYYKSSRSCSLVPFLYTISSSNFSIHKNSIRDDLMLSLIDSLTSSLGLSSEERLSKFITSLEKVEEKSINGHVHRATFRDIDNFLIFKSPKSSSDSIRHEVVVGLLFLNNLRNPFDSNGKNYGIVNGKKYGMPIPNFSMIYGILEDKSLNFSIQENINPSISFRDFCKTCSSEEFIMYYLQAMLALREANLRYNFTHYDLHPGNLLLRDTSDNYIPYYTSRGKEYIKCNGKIITFIDYGSSYVEDKNQKIGSIPMEKYHIYNDRSNLIHDVYKLLCMSLKHFKDPYLGSFLIKYFNKEESIDEILEKQKINLYSCPIVEDFDIDDWIEYLRNIYPDILVNKEFSYLKETLEIDINQVRTPKDFLEFYDVMFNSESIEPSVLLELITDFFKNIKNTVSKEKKYIKEIITGNLSIKTKLQKLNTRLKVIEFSISFADNLKRSSLISLKEFIIREAKFLESY